MDRIDALLEKPCYIIDFLPEQVKRDSGGQFADVEIYLLSEKKAWFSDKCVGILLKLMCYYEVSVFWNGWKCRPAPAFLEQSVRENMSRRSGTLQVLLEQEDTLLVFDGDCLHISVYNPPENVQSVLEKIALSEGLFWREAAI